MTGHESNPKPDSMQTWAQSWERIARRIRVPLGFLAAALYLFELARRAPRPAAVAWSLALVLPGLLLRGFASGYVRKNRQLTTTGPYAFTRNPLYLGSMLMAAGFALALMSWLVAAVLGCGFALVYIPVIAAEEGFLRAQFPGFAAYSRAVPRLIPRLAPARFPAGASAEAGPAADPAARAPRFSLALYLQHREYNAAIGTILLYLCLLLLRPALAALGFRAQ
jgi:protein-S-isoprenylcysteine O-methyltransferase Ste14